MKTAAIRKACFSLHLRRLFIHGALTNRRAHLSCKTIYFYTKVLSYRDQIEFFESAASRDYIFIAYYNLIRVAPGLGILDIETAYRLWEELCQIRTMPKFCQYDTTNPRIP